MGLFQKLRTTYEHFQLTIAEGNYRTNPKAFLGIFGKRDRLPETTEVVLGARALDTSKAFGGKILWALSVAIASMTTMAWVAAGLGVVGVAVFSAEYLQSRKARNDVITEVNFAGQKVEGTRADLYHLHTAQVQIMNLGSSFQQASMESTSDTIHRISDSVAEYSKRVKVLDGGRYGAGTGGYEFSEPGIKLVHDRAPPKEETAPVASLKNAFDANAPRMNDDEVVRRILELENALPADVRDKLQQSRAAQNPPQQKAA